MYNWRFKSKHVIKLVNIENVIEDVPIKYVSRTYT